MNSHHPDMRASDSDREAVAARLEREVGTGRLGLDEYDERVQRAYSARTLGELATVTRDLPDPVGSLPRHRTPVVRRVAAGAGASAAAVLIGGALIAATGVAPTAAIPDMPAQMAQMMDTMPEFGCH